MVISLNPKHLHHLVAQVVDDLDRDSPGLRFRKRPRSADFAGIGMEHVDAVDLDPDLTVVGVEDVDVGFAEDDEQVVLCCRKSPAFGTPFEKGGLGGIFRVISASLRWPSGLSASR